MSSNFKLYYKIFLFFVIINTSFFNTSLKFYQRFPCKHRLLNNQCNINGLLKKNKMSKQKIMMKIGE